MDFMFRHLFYWIIGIFVFFFMLHVIDEWRKNKN